MKSSYKVFGVTTLSISLFVASAAFVFAEGPFNRPGNMLYDRNFSQNSNPSFMPNFHKDASNDATPGGQHHGSILACQAKENAIKNRSNHLLQLVNTIETKFDAITQRIETYYTTKVVPSGKSVSNYDALVADIATKKTAVQTALTTAQTDANNFSCTTGDPKTQLTQFRTDMQNVKKALQDYRTSIKNLIVAVRSVVGQDNAGKEATDSSHPHQNEASESAQ